MDRIAALIEAICASPANRLAPDRDEPAFDPPLIGVGHGDDPVWRTIKEHIGPFFWLPHEAHAQHFAPVEPAALSVVAWILPQTKATRDEHRARRDGRPGRRWSEARHYGEQFNAHLRREVVRGLAAMGLDAVAPVLLPGWGRHLSERWSFASNWSERHAAFVCGLGTFGLSDGLITARGKAVRVGSVVVRAELPVTPRPYGDDHHAYCLFYRTGKCRICARRCPSGAISERGHDKPACKAFIRGVTSPYVEREQLGFAVNSCGLCQVGVPCEAGIPGAARAK
jgi:epoxyqueuosine reductase QueG